MRSKGKVVFALLLCSLLLIILDSSKNGSHSLSFRSFQLESPLPYIIILSVALGAFVMFLLVTLFPPKRADTLHLRLPHPRPDSPLIRSAQIAAELGEYENAQEILELVTVEDPDYWYARKIDGDLAFETGDLVKAELLYQESLKHINDEGQPLVIFALASLYAHQDMLDPAEDLYKQLLHIAPESIEPVIRLRKQAIKQADWDKAFLWQEYLEDRFNESIQESDELMIKVGIRFELAQSQYEKGAYKQAQALLKHIFRLTDSFAPAYMLAGQIYEKTENESAALKTWEMGLRKTKNPILLKRIGEYFLSRNLPEEAIEFFQRTSRNQPDNLIFEYYLGDLYSKMEMKEEAIKVFKRIQQLSPDWLLNRVTLAELYRKKGEFEKASTAFHDMLDSAKSVSILPWKCYTCNTTYQEYLSFCSECFEWDSIDINQNKAGRIDMNDEEPTALPL